MEEELVLMTNVKCEEQYLDEWITYHAHLGVDKFYLYDNNDDPSTIHAALEKCKYKDRVVVHWFPGAFVMQRATPHWLETYRHKHKAVIFIDADEFFVLHKHATLKELLEEHLYPRGGALAVNWLLFGDNGIKENDLRPVTERFTRRQSTPANQHVKTIAMCKDLLGRICTHGAYVAQGTYQMDTNGTIVPEVFNPDGPIDVAQINHYFCKTRIEWERKRNKGHCDWPVGSRRASIEYEQHNFNEVEDVKARDFYRSVVNEGGDSA